MGSQTQLQNLRQLPLGLFWEAAQRRGAPAFEAFPVTPSLRSCLHTSPRLPAPPRPWMDSSSAHGNCPASSSGCNSANRGQTAWDGGEREARAVGSAAPLLRLLCRNQPLHLAAQGARPVPSLSPPPLSPQRCPHPSNPEGGWVGGVSAGNDNIQRAWEDLGPLREGSKDSVERMGWVGDRTQSVSRHKASSAGRTQSVREQGAFQQDSNGRGLPGQENANLGYGIGVRGERGREPAWGVTILNPVDGERLDFQGQEGGEEGLGLRGEEKAGRTQCPG